MPSLRINKDLNNKMYFITCTIKHWYYIFDRHNRWDILVESLKHCQKHKNLQIFAYVLMLNHLHLIVQSPDVAGFLRDFKKYTSSKLIENIKNTEPTVAELFQENDGKYLFWQRTNLPQLIESEKFFFQKKRYIEENPVRKGYVSCPEHWVYSSAFLPNLLKVSSLEDVSVMDNVMEPCLRQTGR